MPKKKDTLSVVSDYYNITEAASYSKLAKGTIYQLIHHKDKSKIPVRRNGRKPIFLIEEFKQWMMQRTARG